MKVEVNDGVLSLSRIKELDGAQSLCEQVRRVLADCSEAGDGAVGGPSFEAIEVDLSETEFLNSSGLGELIALQKLALQKCGQVPVQVLNPPPPVEQLLELTRLHRIFPILKRQGVTRG
jgi:anti-sigma B factor antagonist